jgi:hypothetical protein
MKELESLSEIDFPEYFQHLYSRWQMRIIAQGIYWAVSVS